MTCCRCKRVLTSPGAVVFGVPEQVLTSPGAVVFGVPNEEGKLFRYDLCAACFPVVGIAMLNKGDCENQFVALESASKAMLRAIDSLRLFSREDWQVVYEARDGLQKALDKFQ